MKEDGTVSYNMDQYINTVSVKLGWGWDTFYKLAGSVTAAHPMALALDLGTSNVRRAAAGSTSPNTGIAGFLKLFHFFPLQAKLVATAHIVPTGRGTYKTSRCYGDNTLPFHKYELVFKSWLGEQTESRGKGQNVRWESQ